VLTQAAHAKIVFTPAHKHIGNAFKFDLSRDGVTDLMYEKSVFGTSLEGALFSKSESDLVSPRGISQVRGAIEGGRTPKQSYDDIENWRIS
jgi:hypothetical protein